jgi:hypothetical protein
MGQKWRYGPLRGGKKGWGGLAGLE